jgi:hypothetical protein
MQNKYGLFLWMFDGLSAMPQILSKIDKIALVFRLSALSSIQDSRSTSRH